MPRTMLRLVALVTLMAPVRAVAQAAPHFTLVPELRIDAQAADLSAVSWLAVSRTGTVAVAQDQDHLIRFFDAAGKSLGTFGRDGAGPGEFRQFGRAGWIGDTLWVGDAPLRRFTLISPTRKLVRIVPAGRAIKIAGDTGSTASVMMSLALYADGSQMLNAMLSSNPSRRPSWAHDDLHTESRIVVAVVNNRDEFRSLTTFGPRDDCGMQIVAAYQFCGHGKFGFDPASQYLAMAYGNVAGTDSGTYRITLSRPDGHVVFSRQYPFVAQPIPAHLRDSLIARSRNDPPAGPSMAARIEPPRVYSPIEAVVVAADGSSWVGLRATPAGNPWIMLSPRGDVTGTLLVPTNVTVMLIGSSVAWGTEKDADDVESVVRFRVVRR